MALTKFKTFLEQAPAKDYVPTKDSDEEVKGLEPRSKGERDFKAKHTIKKTSHPVASDKQFKAEEVEQISESLGKLAGQHHWHSAQASPYSDNDEDDIRHHQAQAKKIAGEIKKKHGDAALKAVKHNTENAIQHDSGTMGNASKKTHSDFVKKHLGGVNSSEHKEYKKHVYDGESTTGSHADIKEETVAESEAMGRADIKMTPSGRKVRKLVRFKNSADAAEKERKEKGEE